ncbi:MAG: cation:proton antiporter, partial [Candidatus Woesearchaeota archaeon]
MLPFIQDFGMLLMVVVVISFLVKLLRQPIIIGYVISGLLFAVWLERASPTRDQVIILSELGITFLLFLVGMEFDLRNLKYLGKDLFIITTIQTVVFFGIAYYAAVLFGFSAI